MTTYSTYRIRLSVSVISTIGSTPAEPMRIRNADSDRTPIWIRSDLIIGYFDLALNVNDDDILISFHLGTNELSSCQYSINFGLPLI